MLKERQSRLLGGFKIFLDQFADQAAFGYAELQCMIVADATSHVPTHLQRLLSNIITLFVHLINNLGNLIRVRD